MNADRWWPHTVRLVCRYFKSYFKSHVLALTVVILYSDSYFHLDGLVKRLEELERTAELYKGKLGLPSHTVWKRWILTSCLSETTNVLSCLPSQAWQNTPRVFSELSSSYPRRTEVTSERREQKALTFSFRIFSQCLEVWFPYPKKTEVLHKWGGKGCAPAVSCHGANTGSIFHIRHCRNALPTSGL